MVMQLPQPEAFSSKPCTGRRSNNRRTPKKHKRLDAICEKEYIKKRGLGVDSNVETIGVGSATAETEPRRSSRARRPPPVLDASPPPSKRRKIRMNGERLGNHVVGSKMETRLKGLHPSDVSLRGVEELGSWGRRLRTRASDDGSREKIRGELCRKMKPFENGKQVKEETISKGRALEEEKGVVDPGKTTVMYSRRPGRVKATMVSPHLDTEIELDKSTDQDGGQKEPETTETRDAGHPLILDGVIRGVNECEATGNRWQSGQKRGGQVRTNELLEGTYNDSVKMTVVTDKEPKQLEGAQEGVKEIASVEAVRCSSMQLEAGGSCDSMNALNVKLQKYPTEDDRAGKKEVANHDFVERLCNSQVKEGRRCGLCGGATGGKPPKRLVQEIGESENEACSDLASDPNYNMWDGFGDDTGWLGRLLGPINDRFGIAGTWVHQHCAVWSPEVYFSGLGCLKNIRTALCRGRVLKCTRCGRAGATIGCRVDRCAKTYHLPCARANGCHFDHHKFLIACTDHRNHFKLHGNQYKNQMKKMKLKMMKSELRKVSNDAGRKDLEAEEKWFENCGEDEEFLKRESKRLHRDILRITPVYIGGSDTDSGKLFQGWESVAGLHDVVQCLKEVAILPLLYPDFFGNLGLVPPRGVLLHGYPGTGKTLVVRALIGSCARGDRRIAYFAQKGADCLGKYVGDAERQLRLLFQVAERSQPSIIFFDEIDGLAPRRTRQQDQTHSSVVSTLLALLDGLKSRGSVVVIGATNRLDAVDPALRRPGRFDREIYFPLPSVKDRVAILSLHTRSWPKTVSGSILKWVAGKTAGFAGADLQALCTQAAMVALKRNFPLQEILSAAEKKTLNIKRHPLPNFLVEERDWLVALSGAPRPCSRRDAGISANNVVSAPLHAHLVACLLQPLAILLVFFHLDEFIQLPPVLSKAAAAVADIIFSVLEKKKVANNYWWSHVQDVLQQAEVARVIEKGLSCVSIPAGEANFSASDPLNVDNNDSSSNSLRNMALPLRKKSGFRILIAGRPKSGQRHVASFLVHYLFEDLEIQKVDMTTISQEGRGDIVQGINQILMKCASMHASVVFMPRVDLWAVQQDVFHDASDYCSSDPHSSTWQKSSTLERTQVAEKCKKSCSGAIKLTDTADLDAAPVSSHAWNIFIEQFESLSLSTSLIVLATSEVPYQLLPQRVRCFFKSGILYGSHDSSEGAIPPFIMQINGDFNPDIVINSSATELAKVVVQLFVQLVCHGNHNTDSCGDCKEHDFIEGDPDDEPTDENDNKMHLLNDSSMKVVVPLPNRPAKRKSNLLAITTFGYQILRYPHFAELCWVTSKLKDGPSADINGPWKDWPFNTCIVHPSGSSDRAVLASGSSNAKGKEKFSLVRGLIAVGLSAYRGVYASLSEVSSEVRKVLELLVRHINEKVKSGKDRCRFIRILSQVAHLEDLVNGWAYTLQSLEMVPNSKQASIGSFPSCTREGSKPDFGNEASEVHKENIDKLAADGHPENIDGDAIAKGSLNSSGKVSNEPNDINFESHSALLNGNCGSSKISNGSNKPIGSLLADNGFSSKDHSRRPHDRALDSALADSGPICFFCCCTGCLYNLHGLMRKILTDAREASGSHWTVDDVHDVVTSLSVNLLLEVKKRYVNNGFIGKELPGHACECKSSGDGLVLLTECGCHAVNPMANPHDFQIESFSKFMYRTGVLVPVNRDEDLPFHCKFEKLCLCRLIEWISWTMKKTVD